MNVFGDFFIRRDKLFHTIRAEININKYITIDKSVRDNFSSERERVRKRGKTPE